jgi:hypothetical protein
MTRPSMSSRLVRALVAAIVLISLSAGAALAGEITGSGKPTPIKEFRAKSICSFSGLNDRVQGEGPTDTRAQSWGQIPKAVRDVIAVEEHPSIGCNGHSGFLSGGH